MQIDFTFQFSDEATAEEICQYFKQTLGIDLDEDDIYSLTFPGVRYLCPIERLPEKRRFSIFRIFKKESNEQR